MDALSDEIKRYYTKHVLAGARQRIMFSQFAKGGRSYTPEEVEHWRRERIRRLRLNVQRRNRTIIGRPKEQEQEYEW